MQQQCFVAEVGQAVQTHEFNQFITVASAPPTEAQQQADFIRHTGITQSSPAARAHLNWLMHTHGFDLRDLQRAWRAGSLRWCGDAMQWRAQHRWLDLAWGWVGIATMAIVLAASLAKAVLHVPAGAAMWAAAFASVVLYGGVAYFVAITSLLPQRTAARVARAYADQN